MRPIVIVGSPRSGTSLTAGLLAVHGVWTGTCRGASPKNPRGFFENVPLLALRQEYPIDAALIHDTLRADGYEDGPWLVKHGTNGWRTWLNLEPQYICIRRDPEHTLRSQMHWQRPNKTHDDRRHAIAKHNHEMDIIRDDHGGIDFWPQTIIDGDWRPFEALMVMLGLEFDPERAEDFVDRSLWHD